MRYGPGHKQYTREKVLRSAMRALRREGPDKLAVADVMRDAGLTHGGFYAHFESKDDLLVNAIEGMFEEVLERLDRDVAGRPAPEGLRAYVDRYLAQVHCEFREDGCPIAALATDVPRMSADARRAFETGLARLASAIAAKLSEMGVANAGAAATSLLAELVGAMVLARCASDRATAGKLLEASRAELLRRLAS